jgi:hypothetical protein
MSKIRSLVQARQLITSNHEQIKYKVTSVSPEKLLFVTSVVLGITAPGLIN